MRISDWSSDVCSSDLQRRLRLAPANDVRPHHRLASARGRDPQRIPMGLQGRMTAVAEGHLTVAQLHRSDRATTAASSIKQIATPSCYRMNSWARALRRAGLSPAAMPISKEIGRAQV